MLSKTSLTALFMIGLMFVQQKKPKLADTYQLQVLFKDISCMLESFCASFSCNPMSCSGCSVLHGVNHNRKMQFLGNLSIIIPTKKVLVLSYRC